MFCPICGKRKIEGDYCDRCGTRIEIAAAASSSKLVSRNPDLLDSSFMSSKQGTLISEKESRWHTLWKGIRFHSLWLLVVIVFVLLGTGWVRWFIYGEKWAIHDAVRAMEDKNASWLAERLVRTDGSFYTHEELLLFTQNLDHELVRQHLQLTPKPIETKWGWVPVYGVEIEPIKPILKTNLVAAQWFLNGELILLKPQASTGQVMQLELPEMLPQPMILVGVHETPYGFISTRAVWTPDQWKGEGQPNIEALFEYRSVSFRTDVEGVQLIVNSVPIGDIPYPKGLELRLLPTQVSVELKKRTPWGEVTYQTGERSLKQGAEYHLPMKDKMLDNVYPSLKRAVTQHIESFVEGARNLDLEKVRGMTGQGQKTIEKKWEPFMAEGYHFQGKLLQLDFYPDQLTMFADDRLQLLATLHFDEYQWVTNEGKELYNESPNEMTYAYDFVFEDGEWKVHSYRPVEAFVFGEKESMLMQEENAPNL
jgi:hypothetical protein